MDPVIVAATELVGLVAPSKVEAIASRLKDKSASESDGGAAHLVTTPNARAAYDRLWACWKQSAISGEVLAGILLGAAYARQKAQQESTLELVWTGPTTPFVPTRRTEQVLLDLVSRAQKELFIVSFVAYDVASIVDRMNDAIARGVVVRILLEASSSHGGSLSVDPVNMMRNRVPSAMLYAWNDRSEPFAEGRVHAKVAVADSGLAFLTSANLTGHALEKNMEAGVVINGGALPAQLRSHLHALITTRVISRV